MPLLQSGRWEMPALLPIHRIEGTVPLTVSRGPMSALQIQCAAAHVLPGQKAAYPIGA